MKYRVNDVTFDSIEDVLDYCIVDDYHYEDNDDFEEWVNEAYGHIEINGEEYWAYDILNNADDYNYRELRNSYCENENDNDRENAENELLSAEDGDEVYLHGNVIHCYEENEEETGDYDGDDLSSLEMIRAYIEEQKVLAEQQKENDKKNEEDLMKLFQTIGG